MGGIFWLFWGKGWGFPGIGPPPTLTFMVSLGTVLAPVVVSFTLMMCYKECYTEAQGLVEVDSSSILDLVGSNQFMYL